MRAGRNGGLGGARKSLPTPSTREARSDSQNGGDRTLRRGGVSPARAVQLLISSCIACAAACFCAVSVPPVLLSSAAAQVTAESTSAQERAGSSGDGLPELILCTQNLQRFGEERRNNRNSREKGRASQLEALVERFIEGRCDLVAVQEVAGKNKRAAAASLNRLARRLSERTGRTFRGEVGEARDPSIRNGFLIADSLGKPAEIISYTDEEIPSVSRRRSAGFFVRAPLGVVIPISRAAPDGARHSEVSRRFFVLNVHSKSRHGGEKDPTGTQFETLRMEYAEATRLIVRRELARLGAGTVAVVLGDHNTHELSASADILTGEYLLADFQPGGACGLTRDLEPDCSRAVSHPPMLVGLFELRRNRAPRRYRGGSFRYRGKESLIDEILISPADLPLVTGPEGGLRIAFKGVLGEGSDHRLLLAEFDF